jgi:hypothetical protein
MPLPPQPIENTNDNGSKGSSLALDNRGSACVFCLSCSPSHPEPTTRLVSSSAAPPPTTSMTRTSSLSSSVRTSARSRRPLVAMPPASCPRRRASASPAAVAMPPAPAPAGTPASCGSWSPTSGAARDSTSSPAAWCASRAGVHVDVVHVDVAPACMSMSCLVDRCATTSRQYMADAYMAPHKLLLT